jgi:2'-5' RNA ligase
MRTFAGFEIDADARREITGMTERLANIDSAVRWVRPENIHVTLYFFGEIHDDAVDEVGGIIESAIHGIEPFTIKIGGISAFPSVEKARVIWYGIENVGGELSRMYEGIRRGLLESGTVQKVEKRPYSPHLTAGRVKRRMSRKLIDQIYTLEDVQFGSSAVKELVLFESILTGSGPKYQKIRTFNLQFS